MSWFIHFVWFNFVHQFCEDNHIERTQSPSSNSTTVHLHCTLTQKTELYRFRRDARRKLVSHQTPPSAPNEMWIGWLWTADKLRAWARSWVVGSLPFVCMLFSFLAPFHIIFCTLKGISRLASCNPALRYELCSSKISAKIPRLLLKFHCRRKT